MYKRDTRAMTPVMLTRHTHVHITTVRLRHMCVPRRSCAIAEATRTVFKLPTCHTCKLAHFHVGACHQAREDIMSEIDARAWPVGTMHRLQWPLAEGLVGSGMFQVLSFTLTRQAPRTLAICRTSK